MGGVHDREGVVGLTRSGFEAGLDAHCEVDEVLACDDRVIALLYSWRGHALDGGGARELPVGNVAVVERGRLISTDQYDPDDRDAMLARYDQLSGQDLSVSAGGARRVNPSAKGHQEGISDPWPEGSPTTSR